MALKDLVADKAALTEETIEDIVGNYVRYDAVSGEIVFTPAGIALKNDKKVLVHLTAILGWPYVTDKPPTTATRPADLAAALGIPGGTLRPILKALKDVHLIAANDGSYMVRSANLDAIASIVRGSAKLPAAKRLGKSKSVPARSKNATPTKKASGRSTTKIVSWIKEGYFNDWRTLKDVHQRLHEHGVIVELTSVSGPLLRAVQGGLLARKKMEVAGKTVWAYRSAEDSG